MPSQYSKYLELEALQAEKDKFDQWHKKNKGERSEMYRKTLADRGSKISRVAWKEGYIVPFGISNPSTAKFLFLTDVPDKDKAPDIPEVEAASGVTPISYESGQTLAATLFANTEFSERVQTTAPAAGTLVVTAPKGKNERPARVKLTLKGSLKGVQSRITGAPYNTYPNAKSVTSPVGQKLAATVLETQESAFAALGNALGSVEGYKVVCTPQKLSIVTK